MGLRFRQYIKLMPGLTLNVSKTGFSFRAGVPGASLNFGRNGVFANAGIPGTGIFARERLDKRPQRASRSSSSTSSAGAKTIRIGITEDGTLEFRDLGGYRLTESEINKAKKQHGDTLRELIQEKCDEINGQIDALAQVHLDTPADDDPPIFRPQSFDVSRPSAPRLAKPGILGWLFKTVAENVRKENQKLQDKYREEVVEWERQKAEFDAEQNRQRLLLDRAMSGAQTAMEIFFGLQLSQVQWPHETNVSFEVSEDGSHIAIDVDLPEIEEMPTRRASMPQRGYKLSIKDMPPTHVQRLYMEHVHSIAFRLLGEAFSTLPSIQTATVSGYAQRPDKATGDIRDEYLCSVRANRTQWSEINFDNLEAIDVVEALGRFELVRDMSKTGVFKAIEPIT